MPLPRAGHPTARAVKASAPLQTAARRPLVVVVVAATPNYLRQASQNLGKYLEIYDRIAPIFEARFGILVEFGVLEVSTFPSAKYHPYDYMSAD